MKAQVGDQSRLCFLEASRVGSPAGDLGSLHLQTDTDEPLGTLSGVLIEPSERCIRYFVVEKSGWWRRRQYLVPTDCLAKVEPQCGALRLDLTPADLESLDEFDRAAIRDFSDEDAIEAMFACVA
jgi:hypothetical protein